MESSEEKTQASFVKHCRSCTSETAFTCGEGGENFPGSTRPLAVGRSQVGMSGAYSLLSSPQGPFGYWIPTGLESTTEAVKPLPPSGPCWRECCSRVSWLWDSGLEQTRNQKCKKGPGAQGQFPTRRVFRRMSCEHSGVRTGDSLHSSNYWSNPLVDAFHKQNSHAPGKASMIYTGKNLCTWKKCGMALTNVDVPFSWGWARVSPWGFMLSRTTGVVRLMQQ